MKCPKCGKEIADDSNFCECCGSVTTPKKRQDAMVNVKWLLFIPLVMICLLNIPFWISWDAAAHREWKPNVVYIWLIVPAFSVILFIASLLLSCQKKLSVLFTIVVFSILTCNSLIPFYAIERPNGYVVRTAYRVEVMIQDAEGNDYLQLLNEYGQFGEYDVQNLQKTLEKSLIAKYPLSIGHINQQTKDYYATYETGTSIIILFGIEMAIVILYLICSIIAKRRMKKNRLNIVP